MKKISFENVTKKFRQNFWDNAFVALDQVNFSINQGELIGFLGANGAGKTTAIKILLGFIKEDAGKIHFSGYENDHRIGFIKKLGYLPEKTYLYQHLTGYEFLYYISEVFALSRADRETKIKQWSERLTIDHALSRPIHTYSKGMQQRLCFVSSLLNDPESRFQDWTQ